MTIVYFILISYVESAMLCQRSLKLQLKVEFQFLCQISHIPIQTRCIKNYWETAKNSITFQLKYYV